MGTGPGLWRHPDFLRLWTGQTISKFGSGITGNALPLAAVLALGAGPAEMGLLAAASAVPVVGLGLVAGAWVDRLRRRPVMIWADAGRALLLASIPAAAALGRLRIEHLFLVAALVGVLTIFFDVAYQSFVPDLVGRRRVLEANSRLASSDAVAEIATPGLTGVLVELITAPMAIALDALSFVGSALFVGAIRTPERPPAARQQPARGGVAELSAANAYLPDLTTEPRSHGEDHQDSVSPCLRGAEKPWKQLERQPPAARPHVGREIAAGLRVVAGSPLLRAFAGYAASTSFFGSFIGTLYALFALRELGLGPTLLGIAIGVGGASNLLGTLVVGPVTRRAGVGRTMLGAVAVHSVTVFSIPLAGGPVPLAFAVLAAGQAFDAIHPLYDVNALAVRQAVAPDALLGRVNATMRVLEGGAAPLGALAGGLLGATIGVRATLLLAAAGIAASALWLALSPLHRLRQLPPPVAAAGTD
jgi:MFS family permease